MKKSIFLLLTILFVALGAGAQEWNDSIRITYKLHGQTRRFNTVFRRLAGGGAEMSWEIERNLKMWRGTYTMTPHAVKEGNAMSFIMPEDGKHVTLPDNETFAILSQKAYNTLRDSGSMEWGGTTFRLDSIANERLYATDTIEGARITVLDNKGFPLVTSMQDNPLEINWTATLISRATHQRIKSRRR